MTMEEIIEYLTFLARYDRSEAKSLHRLILESKGLKYEEILEKPHEKDSRSKLYSEIFQEAESTVNEMIKEYVIYGKLNPQRVSGVDRTELERSMRFLKRVYERIKESNEVDAVLNALDGKFIPPGPGGDFVKTPEIYPTGRNTYQLDPTRIPTETAMERGKVIAEEYVRKFYEKHGTYPKAVGIVLWGFEAIKTGGETVAAIFHLLGIKPVFKGLYIRDLEVIPLEELKRPRIDCVVTICGIFRDTLYNVVELLDRAFKLAAELDEPEEMNYVKAHMKNDVTKHGEKAKFRIFGPPEGLYATSITSLIESSGWNSETEIINAYLESMKFAYGEKKRNIEAKEVLGTLLSNVDVVSQVRDTVEYEITDLDHYYEFLGGLSRAVEEQRGSRPEVLIADTTRENIKVEDARDAIARGVITRITNPKWLDAMLEHGANGATKIADRVEYMLGLAATLHGIEKWMWDKIVENVILDKERNEKMKKANPWAFRKLVSRLLEAEKRGYWKAEKETLERLEKEFLETEGILEENVP
jgi:cobaltochelatase CobN